MEFVFEESFFDYATIVELIRKRIGTAGQLALRVRCSSLEVGTMLTDQVELEVDNAGMGSSRASKRPQLRR